jgi:8-oxo-dGTP pyrophosphatase MutT (NUDIX family)
VNLERLPEVLLEPQRACALEVPGRTNAAVLVPLFEGRSGDLHAVFTLRRDDLRTHAGQISFPGGRRDEEDPDLAHTALREAQEEIGLDPAAVTLLGALQPIPTIATEFSVYPFVGVLPAGARNWVPAPQEVAAVLELSLPDLRAGYERREIERRGLSFRTDVYVAGGHVIWGATARMLADLFDRFDALS